MFPSVDALVAELQPAATFFTESDALEERHVPVIAAQSPKGVVAKRTEGADRRKCKGRRIEPLTDRVWIGDTSIQVWPVRGIWQAVDALVAADSDVDWQARLDYQDARNLPATDCGPQ